MADLIPGRVDRIAPHVRRIVAPNGGMMTGPGTNTYLIGSEEVACIDPGPDDAAHIATIVEAAGGHLRWICATHTHRDHSPGVAPLAERCDATIVGMPGPRDAWNDATFSPDQIPADGQLIVDGEYALRAVFTPGHASNHFCYLLEDCGMLFTGDHIMNGSTVVIAPPDGDMQAYLDSLEKLKSLGLASIAPGHGDVLDAPDQVVDAIVAHRLGRERKVLRAVEQVGPAPLETLVKTVYAEVDRRLYPLAMRSLEAHLLKLKADGRVVASDNVWEVPGS